MRLNSKVRKNSTLRLLDCTLRDGGLTNHFQFSLNYIQDHIRAVAESGVQYIELGYKHHKANDEESQYGFLKYCREEEVNALLNDLKPHLPNETRFSFMADIGRTTLDDIVPAQNSYFDLARVACYSNQIEEAISMCCGLKILGYETMVNVMAISEVPKERVNALLKQLSKADCVDGVYLVDSYGALLPQQVSEIGQLYKDILPHKALGIHTHNNLQLALANTLEALKMGFTFCDGSMTGLGRGGGNAPLELMLPLIKGDPHAMHPLLKLIDGYYVNEKVQERESVTKQMITGIFNAHPTKSVPGGSSTCTDLYHHMKTQKSSFNLKDNPMHLFNESGHYGRFGGSYVSEMIRPAIEDLKTAFNAIKDSKTFEKEYLELLKDFSGRPTPLTFAKNLTEKLKGGQIFIKREDLNHTGAHKINNVLGQGLLMKHLGKTRVIAETGAGQHGVATAIMAAQMGFQARIYMGAEDAKRQYNNVFWMKQLGAEVIAVESGTATLKDAINEALRDWATHFETTHYCLGTACGPAPFPEMVSRFQSIISAEIREQCLQQTGYLPSRVYACLGGGSNAMGAFYHFLETSEVELIGVEAGGKGSHTNEHAARMAYNACGVGQGGRVGISQGYKTLFLQDEEGQMRDTWSISAGLDYTGVSPIVAHLNEVGRVRVVAATDAAVIEAFQLFLTCEGIIPALESTHAIAAMLSEIKDTTPEDIVIVNLSGRGDKDIFNIAEAVDDEAWKEYIRMKGAHYESRL